MHQVTCAVDEAVCLNGIQVHVIEINGDQVTFGLSFPTGRKQRVQIALPCAAATSLGDDDAPWKAPSEFDSGEIRLDG